LCQRELKIIASYEADTREKGIKSQQSTLVLLALCVVWLPAMLTDTERAPVLRCMTYAMHRREFPLARSMRNACPSSRLREADVMMPAVAWEFQEN
jgi:hypothetical protein